MATSFALTRIEGTLPEKVEAFRQMMACASAGAFGGWDTPQKIGAGCWMADGMGCHPAQFMQGVHCMVIDGRVILTPKWEFEAGLVRSRLPGFDFTVIEETEEACEIEFWADGRAHQKVRYTVADAKRQGLWDKNKSNWPKSPKEMNWKAVWHRGLKRLAADVLMGLPAMADVGDEDEATELALPSGSRAEVVDDMVIGEFPGEERKAEPEDYFRALSDLINAQVPGCTLEQRLDLCSRAMTASIRHSVPTADAMVYKKANQMGPVDAKVIYNFLRSRPDFWSMKSVVAAGVAQGSAAKEAPAMEAAPAAEPCPECGTAAERQPEGGVEPDSPEVDFDVPGEEPEEEPEGRSASDAYTEFMAEVLRARPRLPKIAGKQPAIVSEYPSANCGKWWLNSAALAQEIQKSHKIPTGKALLLYDKGEVKVSVDLLDTMTACLRAMVKKVGAK